MSVKGIIFGRPLEDLGPLYNFIDKASDESLVQMNIQISRDERGNLTGVMFNPPVNPNIKKMIDFLNEPVMPTSININSKKENTLPEGAKAETLTSKGWVRVPNGEWYIQRNKSGETHRIKSIDEAFKLQQSWDKVAS